MHGHREALAKRSARRYAQCVSARDQGRLVKHEDRYWFVLSYPGHTGVLTSIDGDLALLGGTIWESKLFTDAYVRFTFFRTKLDAAEPYYILNLHLCRMCFLAMKGHEEDYRPRRRLAIFMRRKSCYLAREFPPSSEKTCRIVYTRFNEGDLFIIGGTKRGRSCDG